MEVRQRSWAQDSTSGYELINEEDITDLSKQLKEKLGISHQNSLPNSKTPYNTPATPPLPKHPPVTYNSKKIKKHPAEMKGHVMYEGSRPMYNGADYKYPRPPNNSSPPNIPQYYLKPAFQDDQIDNRPVKTMYATPAMLRYARSDSPPPSGNIITVKDAAVPAMYSSYPVPARVLSKRAARKGKEQSEMYIQTTDSEYESEGGVPNTNRDHRKLIGKEVYQDKKKRRAVYGLPKKIYQDAANTCDIEVDDDGCLLNVLLTDDILGTDLRFGRQQILFQPPTYYHDTGAPVALVSKKKPRPYKVGMRYYAPIADYINPVEYTGEQEGKLVKVRRRRLKTKTHKSDPVSALEAYEVLASHEVHSQDDEFHDERAEPEYVVGPERMTLNRFVVVPEEFTDEVPMGIKAFARDRIARWTYTSSSESSDEEQPTLTPKDLAHRGVITEYQWKKKKEKDDAQRRATLRAANQKTVEEIQAQDERVAYHGGLPEYTHRASMSRRGSTIPDMDPYAVPTKEIEAEERKRYRLSNTPYIVL